MATRPASKEAVDLVTRLSNRAAALAFASAFTVIVALVSLPYLVRQDGAVGPRIAAAVALAATAAATGLAWRARARLRAARQGAERPPAGERSEASTARLVGAGPSAGAGARRHSPGSERR